MAAPMRTVQAFLCRTKHFQLIKLNIISTILESKCSFKWARYMSVLSVIRNNVVTTSTIDLIPRPTLAADYFKSHSILKCTHRTNTTDSEMDLNFYEKLAENTLNEIEENFERVGEHESCPSDFDISSADGVLTVRLGKDCGTYVINKQTPNRQIWLSSPFSGPKRYDYIDNRWIYLHDGVSLDELLTVEISKALCLEVKFNITGQDL
ncbi:frataxin, mitochondrial-like [Antedon mediterranea]|uniref:frataxin, mitochondrial-like n=1 Tax=Antedon mediterranea TaxID=105859 RepID=UPI003AF4A766